MDNEIRIKSYYYEIYFAHDLQPFEQHFLFFGGGETSGGLTEQFYKRYAYVPVDIS
jgi:hypothetical protein